jgi:hypothetical protein
MGVFMLEPNRKLVLLEKLAAEAVAKATKDAAEAVVSRGAERLNLSSPNSALADRNPVWSLIKGVFSKKKKEAPKPPALNKSAYVAIPTPTPTPVSVPGPAGGLPGHIAPKLTKLKNTKKKKPVKRFIAKVRQPNPLSA